MTQKDKTYIINLNQHLSIYVVGTDNEYRPITLMINGNDNSVHNVPIHYTTPPPQSL